MIPKIIHYCWFGPNEIPDQLKEYIKTWDEFCPDYEIKLWNEQSFDISSHAFTQTAYQAKKYAYVSDYVRAYALNEFGGIYLDTDVELKENIDIFLQHQAFTGFECLGAPFTAVWGSISKHSLTQKVLAYYQNKTYSAQEPTNTASISEILVNQFGINSQNNIQQYGSDKINSIIVYPSTTFCLDLQKNYATHHFSGSWIQNKTKSYKINVHEKYIIESIKNSKMISTEKEFLRIIAQQLNLKTLIQLIRYFIKNKF